MGARLATLHPLCQISNRHCGRALSTGLRELLRLRSASQRPVWGRQQELFLSILILSVSRRLLGRARLGIHRADPKRGQQWRGQRGPVSWGRPPAGGDLGWEQPCSPSLTPLLHGLPAHPAGAAPPRPPARAQSLWARPPCLQMGVAALRKHGGSAGGGIWPYSSALLLLLGCGAGATGTTPSEPSWQGSAPRAESLCPLLTRGSTPPMCGGTGRGSPMPRTLGLRRLGGCGAWSCARGRPRC